MLNCKNLVISFNKKGILHSATQPAILGPDFYEFFWKGENIPQEDWEKKSGKKWETILSEFGASLTKNQLTSKTEEVKVSDLKIETKPSSSINFKDEAKSASLRVLANKSSLFLKNTLLKLATRRASSPAEKNKISQVIEKIFEMPEGNALFQFLMGSSLPHLSKIDHLSKFEKPFEMIGEEMRIGSMTDLGLIMVDKLEDLFPTSFLEDVSKEFETTNIRAEFSNEETSKKKVKKDNKTEELDEVSKLVKSMSST